MKITLTIPNVSTNRLYTNNRYTGKRILTAEARATKQAWAREAKTQYMKDPVKDPCECEVTLYFPDKKRRDVDNIKALLDAMTGVLWEDDSLIDLLIIRKYVDKENARIELRFMTYG